MTSQSENIKVEVRCRPFSKAESTAGNFKIIQIDEKTKSLKIISPKNANESKDFTFDAVFGETSTQVSSKSPSHIKRY